MYTKSNTVGAAYAVTLGECQNWRYNRSDAISEVHFPTVIPTHIN